MGKNNVMMVIIIVLLVVLLATVGGVTFYIMQLIQNTSITGGEDNNVPAGYRRPLKPDEITKVSLGDSITTIMIGEDDNSHTIRISVMIGYDNTDKKASPEFEKTFKENLEFAKSIALTCIRNFTYEELMERGGDSRLADTIKTKLQDEFYTTLIVDVYFSEWLIL